MGVHANAKLGPAGRRELVGLIREGSTERQEADPAAVMTSAKAGSMWPTAKMARAMMGDPPDSSSTLRSIGAAESQ